MKACLNECCIYIGVDESILLVKTARAGILTEYGVGDLSEGFTATLSPPLG